MISHNHKIESFALTMIKTQDKKIQNFFDKKIHFTLNVETTNNLSNLFHGQNRAEYYLEGPKIILMALYSIFF